MNDHDALVADISPRLTIDTDLARRVLVGFIRDAHAKAGMTRCVVGLSGGIDSALSATLAAEALGPENVLAIRLPAPESSQASWQDAGTLIEALGLPHEDIPIGAMAEQLFTKYPSIDRLRRGNIYARLRMLALYDQSAAWGGLVLGTSNKTEILLGYSTIYGDSAAALQPIADLYKHQVRQLASALALPAAILTKAPTADLWEGQTDESELGFTYDLADVLLFLLVDERYSVAEVNALGFDGEFVQRFWERVKQQHYKRTMPNVAKLSRRTLGHDFLYLRDYSGRPGRL